MKKKMTILFSLILTGLLLLSSTGCKKSSPTDPIDMDTTNVGPVVRKPNIYIYPEEKSLIAIKLEFPMGGSVIESIPKYSGEWIVEVEPTGRINNQYDYLFYECQTPDAYQYDFGWSVSRDSLELFFKNNLSSSGFKGREIDDFIDYWIPRLREYPNYIIYPQFINVIDKIVKLKINKTPDSLLRLFYVIKGSENKNTLLQKPVIPKFERNGFAVVEWGVVIK